MNSLSRVLRTARANWPNALFERLGESGRAQGTLDVAALDALADHFARRWRDADLPAHSSTLMLGAPEPQNLAAIVGALRAGLDVWLAAPALDPQAIVAMASAREATVLAGPGEFAGIDIAGRLFEAAALRDEIRLVGLYGSSRAGAFELDAPLDSEPIADTTAANESEAADPDADAAREWIGAAGISPNDTIISMASLGGSIGLMVGAFAPLLAGANLIWQAPFAAQGLFEALARAATVHLVARPALAGDLVAAGLFGNASLASLTLISAEGAIVPELTEDPGATKVFVLRERNGRPLRLERVISDKKSR